MVNLGTKREVFWDDFILNTKKTTAEKLLHHPVRRGTVFTFDEPWEGDGCGGYNFIYDDEKKVYRMIYDGWWQIPTDKDGNRIHPLNLVKKCFIESSDGLSWNRLILNKYEYDGSKENNIAFMKADCPHGMVSFIMKDTNPEPKVKGKYKALSCRAGDNPDGTYYHRLSSYVSDDGINFEYCGLVCDEGAFDTINTVYWSDELKSYVCFFRYDHMVNPDGSFVDCTTEVDRHIRDIRVIYSKDFINWTKPQHLDFGSCKDVPLYTNCVTPYPGAEHILVGLPSRYIERRGWTSNFERLCGKENRLLRREVDQRFGETVTDCIFMCSRDGKKWKRYDEAFITPGPENPYNWVYGNCYPAVGFIKTPSEIKGADDELSIFMKEKGWSNEPAELVRYTLRQDGFVSCHAGAEPKKVVTKDFKFEGDSLQINFSTSAYGYVYVKLMMGNKLMLSSRELFGDRVNRTVDFDGGLEKFSGNTVHLEFELCDADIYAFQFFNSEDTDDPENRKSQNGSWFAKNK